MTGVLNSIFVYGVAYHVQRTITRITCCLRCGPVPDIEAARARTDVAVPDPPQMFARRGSLRCGSACADTQLGDGAEEASRRDRFQKHISDTSTLFTISGYVSDSNGSKSAYKGDLHVADGNQSDQFQPNDRQLLSRDGNGAPALDAEASEPRASPPGRVSRVAYAWLPQNVFLTLSLLLFVLVGLPVSLSHQNDLYLDLGFLFMVWLTFTSAQLRTKQHIYLSHRHRKVLTAAAALLNPVLWTSLFLVCYGLAKSSIRNQPSAVVIAGFTTKNTVSDLIAQHALPAAAGGPRLGRIPIGAGDVATSILNAGIVSWGLKLFEYRHQIVSSGGLTVLATSLLASLLNVVAWPLLARAVGVRPASWDLSFAARSVTIALGGPAMKSLGGDAGVNAVGVVVNGICFQLAAGFFSGGDGVAAAAGRLRKAFLEDGWAGLVRNGRVDDQRELQSLAPTPGRNGDPRGAQIDAGLQVGHGRETRYSSDATHVDEHRPAGQNDVNSWGTSGTAVKSNSKSNDNSAGNNSRRTASKQKDDGRLQALEDMASNPLSVVPTVAAGVTIGINAAAMGTAHLYEQKSHAAPYSALSMTVFGVFTVLFCVRSPMTEWLARTVGGGETGGAMMSMT